MSSLWNFFFNSFLWADLSNAHTILDNISCKCKQRILYIDRSPQIKLQIAEKGLIPIIKFYLFRNNVFLPS